MNTLIVIVEVVSGSVLLCLAYLAGYSDGVSNHQEPDRLDGDQAGGPLEREERRKNEAFARRQSRRQADSHSDRDAGW
jgi:hypothetical protein